MVSICLSVSFYIHSRSSVVVGSSSFILVYKVVFGIHQKLVFGEFSVSFR